MNKPLSHPSSLDRVSGSQHTSEAAKLGTVKRNDKAHESASGKKAPSTEKIVPPPLAMRYSHF
ncbi:MAG TPA: hypothetical protein VIN57_03685 [Magnetovibrio sp.]